MGSQPVPEPTSERAEAPEDSAGGVPPQPAPPRANGGSPPRRRVPRMPLGKLVAVALVANVFLAAGAAAVFAPVESSRTALKAYDGLPSWMRAVLGDRSTETGDDSRVVGTGADRGPVGSWLEDLYIAALAGDRDAQLALPLPLTVDVPEGDWASASTLNVSWLDFDSGFRYRVAVTEGAEAPDLHAVYAAETTDGFAKVGLPEGLSWVHVQAADGEKAGPVATAGPFQIDRSAPPAPSFQGGTMQTVGDYHFTIAWNPVTDDAPVEQYRLEKSRTGTTWETIAVVAPETLEHRERNQPNGVYHYRVRAVNAAGLLSAPEPVLRLTVDARTNLQPPAPGSWHYGLNATYDSVIHMWDLSDPSQYLTLNDLGATASPAYGGLSAAEYQRYTAPGWGIELDNEELCTIAARELSGRCTWDAAESRYRIVGGEKNTLEIGILLFKWLFDATDYDFEKFNDPTGGEFLRASETLARGGGICGDLTALYLTMMRMADVPARPVHGYLVNNDDGIGGFHMWAEIYVGGHDPVGDGWIPVDVSGVTGPYQESLLFVYFGLANPMYLQLGIQEDLGEPDLPRDDPRARWNVWANLQYTYYKKNGASEPNIDFDADAKLRELSATKGRLWFDSQTRERVFCEGDERCKGIPFTHYYEGLRGRSVRNIDYGAELSFADGSVEEITLRLKYPELSAPNQVVIYTPYQHNAACYASVSDPAEQADGFFEWVISGDRGPCSR